MSRTSKYLSAVAHSSLYGGAQSCAITLMHAKCIRTHTLSKLTKHTWSRVPCMSSTSKFSVWRHSCAIMPVALTLADMSSSYNSSCTHTQLTCTHTQQVTNRVCNVKVRCRVKPTCQQPCKAPPTRTQTCGMHIHKTGACLCVKRVKS